MFNGSYLPNLPIICSDHGLIMLHVQTKQPLKGKPDKLEAWTLFRKDMKDDI